MANREVIFVYGSLRRGMRMHQLLAKADYLGLTCTTAQYTLYHSGSWPAAVTGGGIAIRGELYEVSKNKMLEIDNYEGHPRLFRRTRIVLAGSQVAFMWIYVCNVDSLWEIIPTGDWTRVVQ